MPAKRIFTVGFDLPGSEFEYIKFDTDQTLLDADIILFQPGLGLCSFEYGQEWAGKPVLSETSSFSTKARLDHWRAEIIAAFDAGKLVIIYLAKPIEYYRYTGRQEFSGTGRSRVATNVVTSISSYEAIPNIRKITPEVWQCNSLGKGGCVLGAVLGGVFILLPV